MGLFNIAGILVGFFIVSNIVSWVITNPYIKDPLCNVIKGGAPAG